MSSEDQFLQADSRNLPNVDMFMVLEYFQNSDKYNVAEIRGVKSMMSSRSSYVENAVGYVAIKRDKNLCIVRAKVVPEHKITKGCYEVTVTINEDENGSIIDSSCNSCPASAGGCKHSLVVIFWLQKKSSEPPSTSVQCYWIKPTLAREGTQPICARDMGKEKRPRLDARDLQILHQFYEECKKHKIEDSLITSFMPEFDKGLSKFCIFDMLVEFIEMQKKRGLCV